MGYAIFLDDERFPGPQCRENIVILRSVNAVKEYITVHSFPNFITFDHDLGNEQPTGYDLAKWLVEQDLDCPWMVKNNFSFEVHSMNPIGAHNIHALLTQYLDTLKS
jgi:hypothetical protein